MADTLLDWFSSLASPVIPEKCTSKLEKGEKIDSEFVKAFMNMVCLVIIIIILLLFKSIYSLINRCRLYAKTCLST